MAVSAFSKTVRVVVPVGDEQVVLICRKPTAEELNRFLSARFVSKGRKVQSNLVEARLKFMDRILVNVENAEYETASGESKPLNNQTQLSEDDRAFASSVLGAPVQSWKDLVNMTWKCSAAMSFEESIPEDEVTEKN